MLEHLRALFVHLGHDVGAEAHGALAQTVGDDGLDAVEGAAADEEDVGGVDLDEFLMRVLASALGRHGGDGALQDLQQGLLHALAGHVPGDAGIFRFAGDLVDLVDIDDALLGLFDVPIRGLDQLEQDVFHVLAHVAGLGQGGGVRHGEGHLQNAGQGLGQQGLAAAGGAQHDDVGFLQLHPFRVAHAADALIVVVNGHRQVLFGQLLPDDVLVQHVLDLGGLGDVVKLLLRLIRLAQALVFDDLVAQVDALVADIGAGPGDELGDFVLRFAAEGAMGSVVRGFGH